MDTNTSIEPERELPTAVQLHILSFLPPNDRALSGRLASKAAASGLSQDPTCTASLSQPLPPHAVPWAVEAGQQHVRQLPFRLKPQLLCTAAASGSEVNLGVAWESLQPSMFPEQQFQAAYYWPDPGVAAVRAGHPQLLGWLAQYCPELLKGNRILRAAAQRGDLAGLQAAWDAVQYKIPVSKRGGSVPIDQRVLDAAAGSATGDAVAKMEWLLSMADYSLQESTAAAAARSGDVGRLRWLRQRGCPMGQRALHSALQHADLAVAQWLVDEAGCKLPTEGAGWNSDWRIFLQAAAGSADAFAKIRWLQEHGAPPLQNADEAALSDLVFAAAEAGQAEVLRHLLSLMPSGRDGPVQTGKYAYGNAAAESGSIPTAEILLQAGACFTPIAYEVAYDAKKGHEASMAMIRWLATEAGVRVASVGPLVSLTRAWVDTMAGSEAGQAGIVEGVKLAVGEGTHRWATPANSVWTDFMMQRVHAMGNLGLAQFLVPLLGLVPDGGMLVDAARSGCEALLEWMVREHPGCVEGASLYVSAAKDGDRGTLTALRRLGVPWGPRDTVANIVRHGCRALPVLRWLVEQGAPVGSRKEMEVALKNSKFDGEVQSWLRGLARAGKVGEGV